MRIVRFVVQPLFVLGRLYWFLARPKTYGVKCIIEHEGKYLFIRNNYGRGRWTFPGGGVKREEKAEDAARREVREEVGIELSEVRHLGSFEHESEYKRDTMDVFHARVSSKAFNRNSWEIAEVQWFSKDNPPEPLSPLVGVIKNKFVI